MRHGILHLVTGAWLAPGAAWTDRAVEAVRVDPVEAERWLARHAPDPGSIVVAELPAAAVTAA